jgi:hypothetical protein
MGSDFPMILFITSTFIIGVITEFVFFNEGELFHAVAGQILNGLLSIACFALVGVAFWRFGWKVGVINLALLFIASNVGLTSGRNLWPVIIGHGLFDASRFILFYFEGPPTG